MHVCTYLHIEPVTPESLLNVCFRDYYVKGAYLKPNARDRRFRGFFVCVRGCRIGYGNLKADKFR